MKSFLEYVNEIYYPKELSTEDMLEYLKKNHDTNLHQDYIDRIKTFNKFILKDIPVDSINIDVSVNIDKRKIEQYKKMDYSKSPPIVLGDGYILDGYHRESVAKAVGLPIIKAYVGELLIKNSL